MSASAIVMMILSMLLLWGGLIAAILKLRSHPDQPEPDPGAEPDPPQGGQGAHRTN